MGLREPAPFPAEKTILGIGADAHGPGPAPAGKASDESFCKLPIDDFVSGRKVLFDVHMRLAQDKFVKLIHAGEDLPTERIEAFRNKGVKFLYMRKEDFAGYLGFNAEIAKKIKGASFISQEKKLNFVRHTSEII